MIRAVSGRVLNIPTEWSSGVCTLSPGHLAFVPSTGIVGSRDIEVLELCESDSTEFAPYSLEFGPAANFIVTTSQGELLWMVPKRLGADVSEHVRAHST
jgi:hypothetical protein